jgi:hypothetical protein
MNKWRIMPHLIVRRAGFPIDWLEHLRFTDTLAAVQDLLKVEQQLDEQRDTIVREIERLVVVEKKAQDRSTVLSDLSKLRKALWKRKSFQGKHLQVNEPPYQKIVIAIDRWNELLQLENERWARGRELAEGEHLEKRAALQELLDRPRLREAMWSMNPRFDEAITRYQENSRIERRSSEDKRFERRLITYLQRLCAKNETNSFFGPIDYAKPNVDQDRSIWYEWTVPHLRRRQVFLSYWAAETLLHEISRDQAILPFLRPRRHTLYRQVCEVLQSGMTGREWSLSPLAYALYERADGKRSLGDLAETLEVPLHELITQAQRLVEQKALTLMPVLPGDEEHSLGWILNWLFEQPATFPGREDWIRQLTELQQALQRLETSEWPERKKRMHDLEQLFVKLTAKDASRESGEMYADRSIIFEDAHGPLQVELGGAFWEHVEEQLQPILEAAKQYGLHKAQIERSAATRLLEEWSDGRGTMPYFRFIQKRSQTQNVPHIEEPISVFQEAVTRLWMDGVREPIHLRNEHLQEPMDFAPSEHRVADPLFLSLDLMLIPQDSGGYQIVVGETHPLFLTTVFPSAYFYADREQMMAEITDWLQRQPAAPHFAQIAYHRKTKIFPYSLPGKVIEILPRLPVLDDRVLAAGELFVSERSGDVYLHDASGHEWRMYPPLHAEPLDSVGLFSHPRLEVPTIKTGRQTPRILFENVMLQRARWEVECKSWQTEQGISHPFDLMLHFYRLKEREGMPDWVFVRVEGERKPFCIDFANVFLLEMLQGHLKSLGVAVYSEMLPAPDQLWLEHEGERYCCEFRAMSLFDQ